MPLSPVEEFRAWHDYYVLIGTAAATLIGAMFVVASLGSSFLTRQHAPQIRAFMTPTVIHLSSVLLAAALATVPSLGWEFLGGAFGLGGGGGMVYSLVVGWGIARRRVEWSDQIWYALIPIVGYGVIAAAALTIALHAVPNFAALAAGAALLLVAGIRNAWDMIIFFAAKGGDSP
jgi:hypothetical protein